jgi:hypothetical protein
MKLKCPKCRKVGALQNVRGVAVCTTPGCSHREAWQPAADRELAWRVARL